MLVKLSIPSARSLKDKRRVIKSLVTRLQNRHHVSVAEVGENDRWQACELGVAVVSNRTDHAHQCLDAVIRMIEREHEMFIVEYQTEVN